MPKRWRARKAVRTSDQWDEPDDNDEREQIAAARWLLTHQPFISVERYDEDLPGPIGATFLVGLHEIAGHQFPDLLDETVTLLLERPDVDAALNEGDEAIHIWAPNLDAATLAGDLRRWWCDRLRVIAPVPLT